MFFISSADNFWNKYTMSHKKKIVPIQSQIFSVFA